jgi:hypothetical protein
LNPFSVSQEEFEVIRIGWTRAHPVSLSDRRLASQRLIVRAPQDSIESLEFRKARPVRQEKDYAVFDYVAEVPRSPAHEVHVAGQKTGFGQTERTGRVSHFQQFAWALRSSFRAAPDSAFRPHQLPHAPKPRSTHPCGSIHFRLSPRWYCRQIFKKPECACLSASNGK